MRVKTIVDMKKKGIEDTAKLESEIDEMVYDLYKISYEERKLIKEVVG